MILMMYRLTWPTNLGMFNITLDETRVVAYSEALELLGMDWSIQALDETGEVQ